MYAGDVLGGYNTDVERQGGAESVYHLERVADAVCAASGEVYQLTERVYDTDI